MRFLIPLLLLATPAWGQAFRPTVVELYTSQGCSSCPPADALLTELQRTDPGLLVLDMHVTYWDRLGWRDPYSLPAATARQRRYGADFGLDSIYTPQMVVDGAAEVVGSDRAAVRQAIARARTAAGAGAVPVSVVADGGGVRVHAAAGQGRGTLLLVGFDRSHTTAVGGGENGGRTLTEVNVVRTLVPAATWSGQAIDVVVPRPEGERAAVLLQTDDGHIVGAAAMP